MKYMAPAESEIRTVAAMVRARMSFLARTLRPKAKNDAQPITPIATASMRGVKGDGFSNG